jgi:hypothetical protein
MDFKKGDLVIAKDDSYGVTNTHCICKVIIPGIKEMKVRVVKFIPSHEFYEREYAYKGNTYDVWASSFKLFSFNKDNQKELMDEYGYK